MCRLADRLPFGKSQLEYTSGQLEYTRVTVELNLKLFLKRFVVKDRDFCQKII